MRRKISSWFLLIGFVFALAGCGGGGSNSTADTEGSANSGSLPAVPADLTVI